MRETRAPPPLPAHLLPLAYAAFVVYGMPGAALGVAWLRMQDAFGRTLNGLGWLLAVLMFANLLTSFNSGRLISRFGVGRHCFVGSALMTLGLLGYVFAPAWAALVAATFVLGLGMGMLNTGVNTFVAHRYLSSRVNWLHAFYGLGATLGPLLVTFFTLRHNLPWQTSFGIIAVLQLGVTLTFGATLQAWRLDGDDPDGEPQARATAADSLRLLAVWLGIALYFVHNGLSLSAGQLSSTFFVEGRGLDAARVGAWLSLYFAAITVGRVLLGFLSDLLGAGTLLRVSTFITVLGAALLWWNPTPSTGLVGLAVMGLSLAPVYPTGIYRTPRLVGLRHSANTIGFQIAGASLGSAALPWLISLSTLPLGLNVVGVWFFGLALLQFVVHENLMRHEALTARA